MAWGSISGQETEIPEDAQCSQKKKKFLIKITEMKGKENFRSFMRKAVSKIQRNLHKGISWIFSNNFVGQKGVSWYSPSDKWQKLTTENSLPGRLSLRPKGEIKSFKDKQKLKRFNTMKLAIFICYREFSGSPVVRAPCFHCRGGWVRSLMRELISHIVKPEKKKKMLQGLL